MHKYLARMIDSGTRIPFAVYDKRQYCTRAEPEDPENDQDFAGVLYRMG
jgi:hypothetical protein